MKIKKNHLWKIASIYLIVFNLILLVIFSGFVFEGKIEKKRSNFDFVEMRYSNSDLTGVETMLGSDNASLTLVLFTDYESPFCRKFDTKVLDKIEEEYVDTGKVRIIIKDSPTPEIHKNSMVASQAVKCANEQNLGFELQDLFFTHKKLDNDKIYSCAEEIGVEMDSFSECLDSQKYVNDVLISMEEAKEYDVKIVPTLFVGDVKIEGLKSYRTIEKVIEEELEKIN